MYAIIWKINFDDTKRCVINQYRIYVIWLETGKVKVYSKRKWKYLKQIIYSSIDENEIEH